MILPGGSYAALIAFAVNAASSFSPLDLGEVKSWMRSDVASMVSNTGDIVYSSLPEHPAATFSGPWNATSNAHPVATNVDGKNGLICRGSRRIQSSASVSDWSFLHDETSDATVTIRFYLYDTSPVILCLFSTSEGAGTSPGFNILIYAGTYLSQVSDGTAATVVPSEQSATAGWHTMHYIKQGLNVWTSVDGETPILGTIANATSADATYSAYIGNSSGGSFSANALISEVVVHGVALDASGLSQMRSYMQGRWGAEPDFSIHKYGNVAHDHNMSIGVTNASGFASNVADTSGHNNDYSQAAAGKRPAIAIARRNGQDAVEFDGIDDILGPVTFKQGAISQKFTVYTVFEYVDDGASQYFHSSGNAGDVLLLGSTDKIEAYAGAGLDTPGPIAAGITIVRAVFDTTGSLRVEQVGLTAQTASGSVGSASPTAVALGAFSGESTHMTGHVYRDFTVVGNDSDNPEILTELMTQYDVAAG